MVYYDYHQQISVTNKVYKVNYDYSRFNDERASITVWYDIGKVGLKKLQKSCHSDIKIFLYHWEQSCEVSSRSDKI